MSTKCELKNLGPNFDREVVQMAKINTTLENEYSRTTPLAISNFPQIFYSFHARIEIATMGLPSQISQMKQKK